MFASVSHPHLDRVCRSRPTGGHPSPGAPQPVSQHYLSPHFPFRRLISTRGCFSLPDQAFVQRLTGVDNTVFGLKTPVGLSVRLSVCPSGCRSVCSPPPPRSVACPSFCPPHRPRLHSTPFSHSNPSTKHIHRQSLFTVRDQRLLMTRSLSTHKNSQKPDAVQSQSHKHHATVLKMAKHCRMVFFDFLDMNSFRQDLPE